MEERPNDIHHDPWLLPVGPALVALVDAIAEGVEKIHLGTMRTGRTRRDARERRRAILGNLIANLATVPPGSRLAISLKNTALTRYARQEFPREVVREMVDVLEALGLVDCARGARGGERTTIAPTAELLGLLPAVQPGDIGRAPGAETILLRVSNGSGTVKRPLDYEDNAITVGMRQDMATINAALAKADIRLDGVRRHDCQLVRIFQVEAGEAPHFRHYGRLYRGFWTLLEKSQRHLLTVDGEDVVDLDYRAMHLALAYHLQGAIMPEGDPYRIPGLERHRAGVKLAISTLFNRRGPINRPSAELRPLLPDGWTGRQLMEAITAAHPAIAPLLGTIVAPSFTRTESDLMVAVLLRLLAQGIVALPIHDGLMVVKSFRADAIAAMTDVSAEMLGFALAVDEKPIWRPAR